MSGLWIVVPYDLVRPRVFLTITILILIAVQVVLSEFMESHLPLVWWDRMRVLIHITKHWMAMFLHHWGKNHFFITFTYGFESNCEFLVLDLCHLRLSQTRSKIILLQCNCVDHKRIYSRRFETKSNCYWIYTVVKIWVKVSRRVRSIRIFSS